MAFADAQTGGQIVEADGTAIVTLAGIVSRGDILGYSSGWKRALATVGGVIHGRCIASEDGVAGQRIPAHFDFAIMSGRISGATAGGALYVAEGTASGQYTQTAPSTTGDANKIVGYAITPTLAILIPSSNNDSIA
jgi:hypothetical protein